MDLSPDYTGQWERRYHPLRQEWVIYAAHRNTRPWTTARNETKLNTAPVYDAQCYLCPTNARVHGTHNPDYNGVYIFDNDHPVVGFNAPDIDVATNDYDNSLYQTETAKGIARVVCYDRRHNVTLADLSTEDIAKVIYAWKDQTEYFNQHPTIKYALIFENKGELCGVSNPHPHCQIYATEFILSYPAQQLRVTAEYKASTGNNIYADIIANEIKDGTRIIAENDCAIAFIPFFARYAYEVMIFPKKRHATLLTLSEAEITGLADVYRQVTRKYDINFGFSFPFVMTIQQAPVDGNSYPDHHFHLLFLPPLRQPGLIKYLGGPEGGCNTFMADTMPEDKAAELRAIVV